MNDKTLTAKAVFLAGEARLDADAFRENTVYNADGDAIRLIANAERLEQYADTIEAQATRIETLEAALRFYARENSWKSCGVYMSGKSQPSAAEVDRGQRARQALESKQ